MTALPRLSTRAFWGLASWALPLAIVFVVSPRLLHSLGADRFGVLMIGLITPLVAAQIDFGIISVGVRRIAAFPVGAKVDASGTLFALLVGLTAIGAFLGALLWILAPNAAALIGFDAVLGFGAATRFFRLCAVWLAVSLPALVPGVVARALQLLRLLALMQTLGTLILWSIAWYLIATGNGVDSVIQAGIVLTVCFAAATLFAIRDRIDWSARRSVSARELLADWRFSAGMFATQVASMLVYQGDRVLIAILGSPAMAGLYALCTNVANKTAAAVSALTAFVFPHAAALHSANQRERLAGLLQALDRTIAALVIPLVLPALALAGPFLSLWVGDYATSEVITAFRILMIGFAMPAFAVPASSILVGTGEAGLPARFAWLTVIVIVAALFTLVPRYGLVGAAAAMAIANSTSFVFSYFARRALNLGRPAGVWRFWLGIALGSFAQFIVLYYLGGYATSWTALLVIAGSAWAFFYAVRAAVGVLSVEERQFAERIRARPTDPKLN